MVIFEDPVSILSVSNIARNPGLQISEENMLPLP